MLIRPDGTVLFVQIHYVSTLREKPFDDVLIEIITISL